MAYSTTTGGFGRPLSDDQVGSDRTDRALLLSDNAAAAWLGISRATLWRHTRAGTLPQPVKFGGRTLCRRDELLAAVERMSAARDADGAA